jgi:hypothetical protein
MPEKQSTLGEQSDARQYLMSGKVVLSAVHLRAHTKPRVWRGSLRGLGTQGHAFEGCSWWRYNSVVPVICNKTILSRIRR